MDAQGPVALGKLLPVLAMQQRQVCIDRLGPAHGIDDLPLARSIGQVVIAPDDMCNTHVKVIDDDREHVGRCPVGPQQHEVVEHVIAEPDVALDLVADDGLAAARCLDAHDRWNVRAPVRR
jgi:hypothetical protein